ncbi:MAG TPA: hypothetical protein DCP31_37940 [Cyanobacteria bacterium UBA8543]|nr:hypothetical protein [Cyanobacteria bacterium UBA8543]
MNIEDIARYYIATPAYKIPSELARNFQRFIIDLAQVELQGINCQYVDFQPYLRGQEVCLEDIRADVNRGSLLVSTQFNESNLLGRQANMIFRCIHDMHHVKLNADFSWQGECASTRHFMSLTDNFLFKQLLFSEILGQSAVYLYDGQFPEHQKVVLFEQDKLLFI